jgi:hypothetical protein
MDTYYIQTSKPERPIFTYNYDPDDFLEPLTTIQFADELTDAGLPMSSARASQVMHDYLHVQRRLRSYYSKTTVSAAVRFYVRELSWKEALNNVIYAYYLSMCLEDEMQLYERLTGATRSSVAFWNLLNNAYFYHCTPSYEFLLQHQEHIRVEEICCTMAVTRSLLRLFPQILAAEPVQMPMDEIFSSLKKTDVQSVNPAVMQFYRHNVESLSNMWIDMHVPAFYRFDYALVAEFSDVLMQAKTKLMTVNHELSEEAVYHCYCRAPNSLLLLPQHNLTHEMLDKCLAAESVDRNDFVIITFALMQHEYSFLKQLVDRYPPFESLYQNMYACCSASLRAVGYVENVMIHEYRSSYMYMNLGQLLGFFEPTVVERLCEFMPKFLHMFIDARQALYWSN